MADYREVYNTDIYKSDWNMTGFAEKEAEDPKKNIQDAEEEEPLGNVIPTKKKSNRLGKEDLDWGWTKWWKRKDHRQRKEREKKLWQVKERGLEQKKAT